MRIKKEKWSGLPRGGFLATVLFVAGAAGGDALAATPQKKKQSKAAPKKVVSATVSPEVTDKDVATAVGHFARARNLLLTAVQEFDRGRKLANPNDLIDAAGWRRSLVARAVEIERVMDPVARTSPTGAKFSADPRLLGPPRGDAEKGR